MRKNRRHMQEEEGEGLILKQGRTEKEPTGSSQTNPGDKWRLKYMKECL